MFVYESARRNPTKLCIGVDANARALEALSEKIHRKPVKGGAPNVLFVQAAVENLPREFDGIATELSVQFPWGSLLQGVVNGGQNVLANLRRLCSPTASLRIVFGVDPERDQAELQRLSLHNIGLEYLDGVLAELYSAAGFERFHSRVLAPGELAQLNTKWARRLRNSNNRQLYEITARVRT